MSRSLKTVLDEANPNRLPSALQLLPIGIALGIIARSVRVPVVSNVAVLPESARGRALLNVFVSAGTVNGQFGVLAPNATPTTTNAALNAVGNVAFFATNAVTEAEITYIPIEGEIVEETLTVASNVGLLQSGRKALLLLSANNTSGGGSSPLTVLARGSSNPAAGNTRVDTAGASMRFEAAVTSATVRYVAEPLQSVGKALDSSVDF